MSQRFASDRAGGGNARDQRLCLGDWAATDNVIRKKTAKRRAVFYFGWCWW